MADNYLERQYAAYLERKTALSRPQNKKRLAAAAKRFYTRVPASTPQVSSDLQTADNLVNPQ